MSHAVATRTTRFAPPSEPSRKATPRRRLSGEGSLVGGRVSRPVLRIVADDERAPVFTRVAPGPSVAREASVGRTATVELVDVAAPLRQVRLDAFFAAEYDGDDQRVEVVRRRATTVRLTRRGRWVVLLAALALVFGLGLFAASVSAASDHPEQTRVITVEPGQTLWDISSRAVAAQGGGDIRSMMSHLESINHLQSGALQVGQQLRVPR
jgi:hypothetical protein